MTAHRILGAVLAALTVTVLVLDITAWPALVLCAALWVGFLGSTAVVERRERLDRAQVARMAERARRRTPDWYREDEGVR